MSITVNVKDIGLKELVALYYNDNGTIREFKEVWTNDGSEVRCLFRKGFNEPLTWSLETAVVTKINSTSNNGYSLNISDMYKAYEGKYKNTIRSNLVTLSKGLTVTMNFTSSRTISNNLFICVSLLDADGNEIQTNEQSVNASKSAQASLVVETSSKYMIALNACEYSTSATGVTGDVIITIE